VKIEIDFYFCSGCLQCCWPSLCVGSIVYARG